AAPNLNVGLGGGFTVEAWINPSQVSKLQPIVEWNNSLGDYGAHFYVLYTPNPGTLYASVRDVNGNPHIFTSPGTVITFGQWQHVALTYDKTSGQGTLYRNGAIVAQSNLGSFTPHTSHDFFLGRRSSAGPASLDGTLDE